MNTYQHTKPTQIAWLGDVPEHWEVKKLKFVLQLSTEKIESQKSDLRYLGMENIVSNTGELTETILQADGIANVFYENDILFGKLRPYLAKVYLAQMAGICSTEFLVYKTSQQIFNKFAFYLMICQNFIATVNSSTYGTKMPRANSDFLANLPIPIPPLSEQTAIAEFLDKKTAQIQKAIALKTEQIARLKEYRQTLINQTVTQGLNPNAPLKNSGVAWLGDMPEHWEVLALKRVITEHSGNGFPIELQGNNGSIPFLKVSDFSLNSNKFIEQWNNSVTQITAKSKKWNVVPKGTLVTAKIGEALRKNHRKILLENSIIDNNCLGIEFIKIDHLFGYYLHCAIDFDWFVNEGAVPSLSMGKYRNFKIPIPPLSEQTAIAEFLDKKTVQIDTAITHHQTQIERLKEYQQSLINDVVTGKISVQTA
ncbi:restriction endonuclease subunit S [Neisseria sp. CCUG17229]|uniref:restriction endonuclease subunit S n=1 Tax=Neisseria sp. CCUG17229 TaxID=3392036 RepID=UPI003A0FCD85